LTGSGLTESKQSEIPHPILWGFDSKKTIKSTRNDEDEEAKKAPWINSKGLFIFSAKLQIIFL